MNKDYIALGTLKETQANQPKGSDYVLIQTGYYGHEEVYSIYKETQWTHKLERGYKQMKVASFERGLYIMYTLNIIQLKRNTKTIGSEKIIPKSIQGEIDKLERKIQKLRESHPELFV